METIESDWIGGKKTEKIRNVLQKSTKDETAVNLPAESVGNSRGSVLIISNDYKTQVKTTNPSIKLVKRQGAKNDYNSMIDLFSNIVGGRNVTPHKNVTKEKLPKIIKDFKESCILKRNEFCVVIFMSYGFQSDTLYCSDGEPINLYKDLVYKFNRKYFADFLNKPRIFVIQSCGIEEGVEMPVKKVYDESEEKQMRGGKCESFVSNIFIGRSSLPHLITRASTTEGTHYIQAIKKVFGHNWETDDLVTLHKKVRKEVLTKDRQTPYHIEFNFDEFKFKDSCEA